MSVYHGLVDDLTHDGIKSVVVILPTNVGVGDPCIVLCQGNAPNDVHSFETVLEAAGTDQDEIARSFVGNGPYEPKLSFLEDTAHLYLSFKASDSDRVLALSMNLVLRCALPEITSLEYEAAIFTGPMKVGSQPQQNAIVFVLYEFRNDEERNPINAVTVWNSKTAVLDIRSGSKALDTNTPQDDAKESRFVFENQSHRFRATLSKDRRLPLEVSVRCRHSLLGPTEWGLTHTLATVSKHDDSLRTMMGSKISQITQVHNDTPDLVTITIQNSPANERDYNVSMASGGMFLAVFGVVMCKAFLGLSMTVVGIPGLLLAAKGVYDNVLSADTSVSRVLYPHDSVAREAKHNNVNDVILFRVYIDGDKLRITSYRLTKCKDLKYNVTDVMALTKPENKMDLFALNLPGKHMMYNRRALAIRGIQPVDAIKGSPTLPKWGLDEGCFLSYDNQGAFGKYYRSDQWPTAPTGDVFKSGTGMVAVIQGDRDRIPGVDALAIRHLPASPFEPMLTLYGMHFRGPATTLIGRTKDSATVWQWIVVNKNNYWAFQKSHTGGEYHLEGIKEMTSDAVIENSNDYDLYFVIKPDSWTTDTYLVKEDPQ